MDVQSTQLIKEVIIMKAVIGPTTPASLRSDFAKRRRNERGQSLVELALSLTVILLLLAGAVDFSVAYFSFSAMQDAAQEGALYGSANPSDLDGIRSRVRNASTKPVDLSDEDLVGVDVSLSGDACVDEHCACQGNEIHVDVTYDYPISMPFIGAIVGAQQIRLKASVTDTILKPFECP